MAGKTALRTRGVSALANDILVHHITDPRTDSDIALAAHNVLRWNSEIPKDSVKVDVEDHVITLTGEVDWHFQRQTAVRLVEHLIGVKDVRNRITLKPRPQANAGETEAMIRRALIRNASIDAGRIHAAVSGTRVVLTGHASSYAEKRQAELAAWSSPHVEDVDNQIIVEFRD
jgi:osmotically-inducible protein OsmY